MEGSVRPAQAEETPPSDITEEIVTRLRTELGIFPALVRALASGRTGIYHPAHSENPPPPELIHAMRKVRDELLSQLENPVE